MGIQLQELLSALPWEMEAEIEDVQIEGLAFDSREVEGGDLFVAFKGLEFDGHDYIPQAIEAGAVAVVIEDDRYLRSPLGELWPLPCILVPNAREALAHMAAAFHHFPSRKLRVIGVTGTDGKTTTVNLIWSVLEVAGHTAGFISSVNAVIGHDQYDTGLHTTTPNALEVQGYLAQMVEAGADYAVLEATSHGLAQHRVTACDFDLAAVTNITHEHLDYHDTFEEYREAKARLFRSLATSVRKPQTPKVAVLNVDDPSFSYLRDIPADVQLTYGLHGDAQFTARDIVLSASGISFTAVTPQGTFPVETNLVGRFNVYNALATISVAVSQEIPVVHIQEGIRAVSQVTGRMERIHLGQPFQVVIDFAHTPNSLQNALEAARGMTEGQITVVFGCAGLRDREKRPVMGEIAGRLADKIVITAEDPRTEDLDQIMAQIAHGCEEVGREAEADYWRIGDRGEAIQFAIDMAQEGDLVLVTGKGHEQSMCFGTTEYPWSDHEAVREALSRRFEHTDRK
ncbi:MAG: UDP-N-acetylmuramoyl-L-alanyl-D-glutamate--2,6-diaminopimelate ligase [Chloroflexi bacterium B3_Chlor]|nr:MAG: UDP-N-acetylmuramoyl-L-alanyl-D-glutamate--2,6-diaminopimelate ligase [Chloroflexi bacterium B3_Chlor]